MVRHSLGRRSAGAVLAAAALFGPAACTAAPGAPSANESAPAPVPTNTTVFVPSASDTPTPVTSSNPPCGSSPSPDPLASWHPPSPMPTPGQMPAGTTMAAIQRRGYLIVGVDQDEYNVSYRDLAPPSAGAPPYKGFDIDMLHAVAAAIFGSGGAGLIKYVPVTQDYRLGAGRQGIVDVVADSVTINCDRWRQVDFSVNYLNAGAKLLVSRSMQNSVSVSFKNRVPTIHGLAGGKVCTIGSTTSQDELGALAKADGFSIVLAENWSDCVVMLQQGTVQAMSTDDTILRGLQEEDPFLSLVQSGEFSEEPHGLAFPRSDPDSSDNSQFVGFVNGVIAELETDNRSGYCAEAMTAEDTSCWAAMNRVWLGVTNPPLPLTKYVP
jgi:polar amino acid transport system substrate-binding protein